MFLFILAGGEYSIAKSYKPDSIVDCETLENVNIDAILESIEGNTIVILSEFHDIKAHHEKQLLFLEGLSEYITNVSVGMEFIEYTSQNILESYLSGKISEKEFLKEIKWGNDNFEFYRPLIFFPVSHGGETLAINAPRTITSKIAKTGLVSLTDYEWSYLPPNFALGNSDYFDRFKMSMDGHNLSQDQLDNYFAAQSAWDDTMAYKTAQFMNIHKNHVFVIIVGDFHAIYGGGLPDRLSKRSKSKVMVISQININGLTESEVKEAIETHPQWGKRADYIWISSEEKNIHYKNGSPKGN